MPLLYTQAPADTTGMEQNPYRTHDERLNDRLYLVKIADAAGDTGTSNAAIQDELDMLTVESIRYWSKSTPTPETLEPYGHLVPPILLSGFIAAASRRRRSRRAQS